MKIREMVHKDLELMAKWLNTKEVFEFFGNPGAPLSKRQVYEKYGPRIEGEVAVMPFIVELNGRPFAFMQCYRLSAKDCGFSIEEKIYGIDQFIGEPSFLDKGYGTEMVLEFLAFLFVEKQVDAVVVDPELSNPRAIRCYEKSGFRKVNKIDGNRKWLMKVEKCK